MSIFMKQLTLELSGGETVRLERVVGRRRRMFKALPTLEVLALGPRQIACK
jgi:hypothetical protein